MLALSLRPRRLARAVQNAPADNITMKTIHHVTSALVAAGSFGVALLTLTNLIPADLGFAGLAVLGISGFALFDYGRPVASLKVRAPVVRPALPAESASPVAYGTRRAA